MRKRKKKPGRKAIARKVRKKGAIVNYSQAHTVDSAQSNLIPQSSEIMDLATKALNSGQSQEAFRLCGQALKIDPSDTVALNLAGVAAFQIGDADQAVSLLETAVAFRPDFANAYINLGNVRKTIGDLSAAEEAYRHAVKISPDKPDAEFNLGILLETQGRFAEAEVSYRRCTVIFPRMISAIFNLGNVLKALGRLKEAEAAYNRALDIDAGNAGVLNNLGTVFLELGRPAEAIHAYRKAVSIKSDFTNAYYNLGVALQKINEHEAALSSYRRALECDSGHVGATVNTGYSLKELGKLEDAESAYLLALQIAPDYDKALVNLGDLYLHQENPDAALNVCEDFLNSYPGNISALAFSAIALENKGNRDAAHKLYDYNRFLFSTNHKEPDGYDSIDNFNQALGDHVLGHPSLVAQPASHATRLGWHSGELLVEPKGPVAQLEKMIMSAVNDYCLAVPMDLVHPWLLGRPKNFGLSAWGVVMDRQGYQLAHIHPSAWLSGVYYPKIPKVIHVDDPGHAGWIEFGRAPDDFHVTVEPVVKLIQPEEGLMLLFPSYYYHRTKPFESDETRISIAFDILPLE